MRNAKAQNAKLLRQKFRREICDSALLSVQRDSRVGATSIGEPHISNQLNSVLNRPRGCVTPTQIENVVKAIGGLEAFDEDPNVLDGYDEVDEASREKIRTALKEGHVPDEDWKGVSPNLACTSQSSYTYLGP